MFHQKSEAESEDSILDICDGDCPETCNWVAIDDLKSQKRFETNGEPPGEYEQFNLQKYLTVLT